MAAVMIREYEDSDEPVVLALLAASLGKTADDRYRAFFRWKHLENPFGRSLMWVAEVEDRIAAFRSFLRWRFVDPSGEPVEAVRAVDTATHPDFQGMGLFRTLTLHAVDEMRPTGVQFVFNTPNEQSRPGYLKMGWRVEQRIPVKVLPRSISAARRMLRSRTAADAWSLPQHVGAAITREQPFLDGIAGHTTAGALSTDRSPEFMIWRYGGSSGVSSRFVSAGAGGVILRFRRRGPAVECTIGDVVSVSPKAARAAVHDAMRTVGADYAIATAISPVAGMLPVRRLGPLQTRRDVAQPAIDLPLSLTLGDVELF